MAESRDRDFLMIGLFENHPLSSVMGQIRHIQYQSRLYIMQWGETSLDPDDKPIQLEVDLL